MDQEEYRLRFQVSYRTLMTIGLKVNRRLFSLQEGINDATSLNPDRDGNETGILYKSALVKSEQSASSPGWLTYRIATFPRYYVEIDRTFDDYTKMFSSKSRSTLRRKLRAFEERSGGNIDIRGYRAADEMADFHAQARALSARTYQERLLGAGLPDSPSFLKSMQQAASADRVRAWLLFLEKKPVSYLYTYEQDGGLVYAYLGYDPDYSNLSVGTVLQWLALQSVFTEGRFKYFDFTEGQARHKEQFATGQLSCADILYLRRTFKHRTIVWFHRGFGRAIEGAGSFADRLGLRRLLTRVLRSG